MKKFNSKSELIEAKDLIDTKAGLSSESRLKADDIYLCLMKDLPPCFSQNQTRDTEVQAVWVIEGFGYAAA